MCWLICGTLPGPSMPEMYGEVSLRHDEKGLWLRVGDHVLPVVRGTPALAAAACLVAESLEIPLPKLLAAGDDGSGKGSRFVYAKLCSLLATGTFKGITFHYLLPDVDWQTKILAALPEPAPCLVADAGYMYAAKMSGYASCYDLFTPDAGELAFLADETAPHPFYTRGFLLDQTASTHSLIERAVKNRGAAKAMLVKGNYDYYVEEKGKVEKIDAVSFPYMEAIGGTGDTVTGIVSMLLASGRNMRDACFTAAKVNRFMGNFPSLTPATQIAQLLEQLPQSLSQLLFNSNHS